VGAGPEEREIGCPAIRETVWPTAIERITDEVGAMSPIVVFVAGELDMAREMELLDLVMSVDAPPGTAVDLDVSEVSFVDSRGLRAILRAKSFLAGRNCEFRLLRPTEQLLRLIELAGVAEHLTVVSDDGRA
jgi:anti-anti-sigma factor